MELDVHLSRENEEPWGFRLIGGVDFKMPLTVVKVLPDSPAEKAGLQNGDTVSRINEKAARDLSHDDARLIIDEAKDKLSLAVARGLYDPVLDDSEPIYEPIDQGDFDQQSQPTEVSDTFQIQQFLDPRQPDNDFDTYETPKISESRSLTASPFVLLVKPYRPFSTEPLDIPPLEDPIILNPNYRDEFGRIQDSENHVIETKFKLPISAQYDPNWKKKEEERLSMAKKNTEIANTVEKILQQSEKIFNNEKKEQLKESVLSYEDKLQQNLKDDVEFMTKMKQEIDINNIEMTATTVVNESIEKAVHVAEEIRKEMDVELDSAITVKDMKESKLDKGSTEDIKEKTSTSTESTEKKKNVKSDEVVSKATYENIEENSVKSVSIINESENKKRGERVENEVKKFENVSQKDEKVEERKESINREVEETIEAGSVKHKSIIFDKVESTVDKKDIKKSNSDNVKTSQTKITKIDNTKQLENVNTTSQASQKTSSQTRDVKTTTFKTHSEQQAYRIGLQTIPNIRGIVHSSYHYNLLLKTFFIHLTDVMVALSRFLLSEPVFSKSFAEENKGDVTSEENLTAVNTSSNEKSDSNDFVENNKATATIKKEMKNEESQQKQKTERVIQETKEILINEDSKEKYRATTFEKEIGLKDISENKENDSVGEKSEKTHKQTLSGSKMAQLSEKKSEELTIKMDAVISEFENKTGIEETVERKRSRSRSRVEEEVISESDPLVWLSKTDNMNLSQEFSEINTSTRQFSSIVNSVESVCDTTELTTSETEGKQTYVAIVESHVFTNKDAIFGEQTTEMSEKIFNQSAKQTNIVRQANEAITTENLTMECSELEGETVNTVVEKLCDLSSIETKYESVVQEIEPDKDINELAEHEMKFERTIVNEAVIKEEFLQEKSKPITIAHENIKQHSTKSESCVVIENKNSLEFAEEEKINIEDVSETINDKSSDEICEGIVELAKEESNVIKEEELLEIEVTADVKIDKIEIKEIKPKIESAELKILKEQIVEVEQSPEILESEEKKILRIDDIVDLSKGVIVESKSKFVDISESNSLETVMETMASKAVVQESSFTAKSSQKLSLRTDLVEHTEINRQSSTASDENNNIDTPTPSTVPPTPLTDEYVFKLQIPLPKNTGTLIVPDGSSEEVDEDPHIVKKKLVPHIDTTLESPIIYDPPLPTPPGDKVQSPIYTKPGLRGGFVEEILEIERRSSLLASAIDETIKSIEEYKEQVGMDMQNGIDFKETVTTEFNSSKSIEESKEKNISEVSISSSDIELKKEEEEWSEIHKQVENNNKNLIGLSVMVRDEATKIEELDNNIEIKENYLQVNKQLEPEEKDSPAVVTASVSQIELKSESKEDISKTEVTSQITTTFEELTNEEKNANIFMSKVQSNGMITINAADSITYESKMVDTESQKVNEYTNNIAINADSAIKLESNIAKDEEKLDPMKGFRPVNFNPEEFLKNQPRVDAVQINIPASETGRAYMTPTGEILGTKQGIVDGLEEAIVDDEVAKELGKPGMTEEKIAELISGESEMLREAHVMGLTRVITSHMNRLNDDSSVDFKKIKPIVESLKDSEVLKALNDELMKTKEEKNKEERKWTTFLQKPNRPVPRAKFGYHAYVEHEKEHIETPYKVKIVKQPKPKVAPDYKPEDFDTGPLPWEERALNEPPAPPVEAEDPILVPEETPEFLEAVDPLPESEVPDLEETGIPIPPPKSEEETNQENPETELIEETKEESEKVEKKVESPIEEEQTEEVKQTIEDMEQNRLADQLMSSVQNMVDPNATLDQQLAQMRAQLAALAQLPGVIQQTLEMVTKQLSQLSQQDTTSMIVSKQSSQQEVAVQQTQSHEENVIQNHTDTTIVEESAEVIQQEEAENNTVEQKQVSTQAVEETPTQETKQPSLTLEEMEKLKKEEAEMLEEQRRIEKQKKEMIEQMKQEQESRLIKQRPTPRVGKPKPVFGPANPERPLVLPGGRKWRGPKDAYNEQFIAETLSAQAEIIQGKAKGMSYESVLLPYDKRINFMKYEKPPVSLDHLQRSDVYKLVHNMDQTPMRRVDMLTPVIAEADYREKCRSISPCVGRMAQEEHLDIPQQVQP